MCVCVCVCVCESRSVVSNSSPWKSPGQNTGMGSLSLLQGIFPTQGSNPGLPHCRRILYQLSLKGLLLLLSHFSRVQLCVTPWTAAYQAPPSLGFSRQEHGSGLPFPSPMRESEVSQSCPILSDPMDGSLPGSSVHGIFQARVLS